MPNQIYRIPLTNIPQKFQITLAGSDYILTCKYNSSQDAGWVLDFVDSVSNLPIVCNIPLITGRDLLDGLNYLNFGGSLYAYTDGDSNSVPTLDNLGTDSNVYFVVDS